MSRSSITSREKHPEKGGAFFECLTCQVSKLDYETNRNRSRRSAAVDVDLSRGHRADGGWNDLALQNDGGDRRRFSHRRCVGRAKQIAIAGSVSSKRHARCRWKNGARIRNASRRFGHKLRFDERG